MKKNTTYTDHECKLKFGTDGIRGKADQFPFTTPALSNLGQAIAKWGVEKYKKSNLKIVIGHDTRISCERIKKDLCAGLNSLETTPNAKGVTIVDAQVLPTPAILQLITHAEIIPNRASSFDFGIVISASHNPYTDNGIKLFTSSGKLTHEDEETITKLFELSMVPTAECACKLNSKTIPTPWPKAKEAYVKNVVSKFSAHFLKNRKVVLDCANGATYHVAPAIFAKLGAQVIPISTNPDGKNINEKCGSLHLELLQKAVLQNKADIGFAFDGDGDRVMAVNKDGIIKDGDDIISILLQHHEFIETHEVAGTIMTNYGLEKHLEKLNKKLARTKVGDKHISAHLENNNVLLGGETSGHIIIKNYLNSGDGIFVALKTLESIIKNNNWAMKSFEKTPQFLVNVPVAQKKDLCKKPLVTIIDEQNKKLTNGRTVVRYSGTENLLRVMVEDSTETSAEKNANELGEKLKQALQPA